MINLLPEQQKRVLLREYHLRVLVVLLSLICITIAIAAAALLPSYIYSFYQQHGSLQQIADANQAAISEHAELAKRASTLKQKVAILSKENVQTEPLDVIDLIIKNKGESNHLSDISFKTNDLVVIIKGVASTRQSLDDFINALKAEKRVANVDLPVSSFAQESNLSFAITVTLSKQ